MPNTCCPINAELNNEGESAKGFSGSRQVNTLSRGPLDQVGKQGLTLG
jgi:hypothetical protein